MAVLVDSYSETNQNSFQIIYLNASSPYGQSFVSGSTYVLNSVKFYLLKDGSPTGNLTARIYGHTGTFGSSSKPDTNTYSNYLAISDAVDVATLTGAYQLITFTFSGTNKINLTATNYCVAIDYDGGSSSNEIRVGLDTSSPSHGGNSFQASGVSGWIPDSNYDVIFYVYADDATTTSTSSTSSSSTSSTSTSTSSTSSSTSSTSSSTSTSSTSSSTSSTSSSTSSTSSSSSSTSTTTTLPPERYWVGGTGNWSDDTNHWATTSGGTPGAGNLPTIADNVFIDSNSGFGSGGTITADLANPGQICNDFTANSGHSYTLDLQGASLYINGNSDFESTMTISGGSSAYITLGINSGAYVPASQTIRTNGVVFPAFSVEGQLGIYTLLDDLNTRSLALGNGEVYLANGTFNANNHNVNCGGDIYIYNIQAGDPTVVNMGSGTWTVGANDTDRGWESFYMDTSNGNPVINPSTSTIKFTDTSANPKTFRGGGFTYNNLWFSGAGTGDFIVTGSNTFNDFKVDTPPHTLKFTEGTTTTVSTFTVSGSAGNLITIDSVDGATQHILSKSSGVVNCDYLDLSNSNATGGATWYAGSNSTDDGGNSGWIFTGDPATTTSTSSSSTSSTSSSTSSSSSSTSSTSSSTSSTSSSTSSTSSSSTSSTSSSTSSTSSSTLMYEPDIDVFVNNKPEGGWVSRF